jgi:hypothetical protein
MPSFAGCLANQQMGSWVGAFRLNEGIALIIVRDDLLVPDGDQFFVDENEARERLLQEIGFGSLQKIYAPESWAVPGSDSMPISLLMDERRDIRLRAVKMPQAVKFALMGIVLVIITVFGVTWYMQQKAEREAELEAARLSALEKARAEAEKLVPGMDEQVHYPPPERKWEEVPQGLSVIEVCRASLANIPVAMAGWRMTNGSCSQSGISITWSRDHGFSQPPKTWIINDSGTSATSSVTLPTLAARGHEDLANPSDITRRYLTQNWPGNIARAPDDPPPPPPPDFKGNWAPPPPPWVKRSFTLTVPDLPSDLTNYFRDLPGVVVNSLTFTPGNVSTNGSWNVEGVIYENRL